MPVTLNATDRKGLQTVYDLCPKDLSKKNFESELNMLKRDGKSSSTVTPVTPELLSDIKMKGVKLSHTAEHMKAANIATWVFLGLAVASVALAIFAPMLFLPLAGIFGALAITSMGLMIKSAVDNVKATNDLAKLALPQLSNLGKLKESQSGNDSPFVTLQKQQEAEAKDVQNKTEEDHKQDLAKALMMGMMLSIIPELLTKHGYSGKVDQAVIGSLFAGVESEDDMNKQLEANVAKLIGADKVKAFMQDFNSKIETREIKVENDDGDDQQVAISQEQFKAKFLQAYNQALEATKDNESDEIEAVNEKSFNEEQLEELYQIAISSEDESGEKIKAAIQTITKNETLTAEIMANLGQNEGDDN